MTSRMAQIIDTKSYWLRSATLPSFTPLDRHLTVDVAIVGGGLAGISTAYLLKSAGLSVALLERAPAPPSTPVTHQRI
jgi:ribulose 1,5-bisphosphate synthetase/thiazole synthase